MTTPLEFTTHIALSIVALHIENTAYANISFDLYHLDLRGSCIQSSNKGRAPRLTSSVCSTHASVHCQPLLCLSLMVSTSCVCCLHTGRGPCAVGITTWPPTNTFVIFRRHMAVPPRCVSWQRTIWYRSAAEDKQVRLWDLRQSGLRQALLQAPAGQSACFDDKPRVSVGADSWQWFNSTTTKLQSRPICWPL